jgi:hypothetical protein
MAVFERNGNYYYELIFDGQRIRESAKTTRKTVALEAETATSLAGTEPRGVACLEPEGTLQAKGNGGDSSVVSPLF